jgi:hypothetical protein
MKRFFSLLPLLWLSFFVDAQSVPTASVLKNIFKDIPMGITLLDFQKRHPNAQVIESEGFRTILEEKIEQQGIVNIQYYFANNADKKPFYEAIIAFDNQSTRESTVTKLFGAYNHPKMADYWVVYKGSEEVTSVAWAFNHKLVLVANIPKSEWADAAYFKLPASFENVDKRLKEPNKTASEPNNNNNTSPTCIEYAKEIVAIFQAGFHFDLPSDSVKILFPKAVKKPPSVNYREEYSLQLQKNGVKEVTFICDKDDNKPLYEAIFEFENADSTRRLAEIMFGKPNHPTLEDHWVSTGDVEGCISMIWLFDNKILVAVNMAKTEFEGNADFVEPKGGMVNIHDNETDNSDNLNTLQMNHFIEATTTDFEDFKGEALPNKKDEFNAAIAFTGAEQTLIRKNAAGKWRLEARFPTVSDIESAKTEFEKQLENIQNLEGLEYRLVKKSDNETAKGRTYIWDIQTLDDESLGVILKLQFYPASGQQFGLKLELGK